MMVSPFMFNFLFGKYSPDDGGNCHLQVTRCWLIFPFKSYGIIMHFSQVPISHLKTTEKFRSCSVMPLCTRHFGYCLPAFTTSIHSSRMRTACLLPVSPSMHCPGGVCSGGRCLLPGGSAPGGVCSGGGGVSQLALMQTPLWRESQKQVKHNLGPTSLRAVITEVLNA